jgi:hypothetical protein
MCEKRAARLFSASTGAMLCVGISRRQHADVLGGGGASYRAPCVASYKTATVMVRAEACGRFHERSMSKTLGQASRAPYASGVLTDGALHGNAP